MKKEEMSERRRDERNFRDANSIRRIACRIKANEEISEMFYLIELASVKIIEV
jgi:hypothetical protein